MPHFFIKGALKIACLFTNNASASHPLPGLRPWTSPLGDFGSQTSSCVQYDFQTILGPADYVWAEEEDVFASEADAESVSFAVLSNRSWRLATSLRLLLYVV